MTNDSTSRDSNQPATLVVDDWFDPIETSLRARAREFIETLLEEELSTALSRPRYGRATLVVARSRLSRRRGRAYCRGRSCGDRRRR